MNMEKETIVRLGDKGKVQLPLGTLERIGVKPGDVVEFFIETREESNESGEYEYLVMKKQPTSNLEIPSEKYIEIQEQIDKKEIPFQTVEEAVADAIEKMIGVEA